MKKPVQLILTIACLALWQVSALAATKYWDIDGATAGAGGATPNGTWNTTSNNWTTAAAGTSAGTTWTIGDDAVFSAGTNATGAFAVVLDSAEPSQIAGNITVQEGTVTIASEPGYFLNIGGGVAGKGIVNVSSNLNLTISSELEYVNQSGDDSGNLTKTGTGTLTLSAANSFMNNFVVAQGTLSVANNTALGSTLSPTIVSNGATLEVTSGSFGESVVLNGHGFNDAGALSRVGLGGGISAAALLTSDARINQNGTGSWVWGGGTAIKTNGGDFNLYIGGTGGGPLGGPAPGIIRLNISTPSPSHAIECNTITKDGACRLQLEVPSWCNAFYFNSGEIFPRFPGFGGGPIYVGASPYTAIMTLPNTSTTVSSPMVLASGANIRFEVRTNTSVAFSGYPLTNTCNGVISGDGALTKIFPVGVLILNANNTYTGNTTVQAGTLLVGVNGSISNSPVIDLQASNAILNVASKANGFVLQSAQTLKGLGSVVGDVWANGTIAPGGSVGTLTFSNNLTIGGNLLIEVDKSLSPSNDVIQVLGTVTNVGSGTMTVTRSGGGALLVGDSFQIFNQAVVNGQSLNVTGAGATWTNRLAQDGSIGVLVAPPPDVPATNLTIAAVGPTSIGLGGMGAASSAYSVYASTNVALPMSNWWKLGTTNSSGGGVIQFVDPQATNSYRFYRFGQP